MEPKGTLNRIHSMGPNPFSRFRHWCADWDPWPLCRLLCVAAMLGVVFHYQFGWDPATLRNVPFGLMELFSIICLFGIVSRHLAAVLFFIFCGPYLLVIFCNRWFYEACYHPLRWALNTASSRTVACWAFGGELVLFLGSLEALRAAALHCGLRL